MLLHDLCGPLLSDLSDQNLRNQFKALCQDVMRRASLLRLTNKQIRNFQPIANPGS